MRLVCYYAVLSEVVRVARAARSTQRPSDPSGPVLVVIRYRTIPY
jgi:hypothetical protein